MFMAFTSEKHDNKYWNNWTICSNTLKTYQNRAPTTLGPIQKDASRREDSGKKGSVRPLGAAFWSCEVTNYNFGPNVVYYFAATRYTRAYPGIPRYTTTTACTRLAPTLLPCHGHSAKRRNARPHILRRNLCECCALARRRNLSECSR